MNKIDIEEYIRRREKHWLGYLKTNLPNVVDQDSFNVIYDMGFTTGRRLGYDTGFNDSQLKRHFDGRDSEDTEGRKEDHSESL